MAGPLSYLFVCYYLKLTAAAIVKVDDQAPQIIEDVVQTIIPKPLEESQVVYITRPSVNLKVSGLAADLASKNLFRVKRRASDKSSNTVIVSNGSGNNNVYVEFSKRLKNGLNRVCKLSVHNRSIKNSCSTGKNSKSKTLRRLKRLFRSQLSSLRRLTFD